MTAYPHVMDLKHLRYFTAAIEQGSLQGAAEKLNVAQPALSRRVRDLELEMGCDLLTRSSRGIAPTPAGFAFYRDSIRLIEELNLATQRARRIGLEQGRGIRFGLAQGSARRYAFLGEALAAENTRHGASGTAFSRGVSVELLSSLRDGTLDIALLYEHRPDSPLLAERLIHRERFVLAAHPAHPLAQPGAAQLTDLSGHALVWLARADLPDGLNPLAVQLRRHGLEPVVGQLVDSPEEQIEIAIASCGACLTPASTIAATPPGQLAFRALPSLSVTVDLSLAWRRAHGSAAVQELLEGLDSAIDGHQAAIAGGTAEWTLLDGYPLFALPG
jgi:DNA-binding transcriptional LysR family regulator